MNWKDRFNLFTKSQDRHEDPSSELTRPLYNHLFKHVPTFLQHLLATFQGSRTISLQITLPISLS